MITIVAWLLALVWTLAVVKAQSVPFTLTRCNGTTHAADVAPSEASTIAPAAPFCDTYPAGCSPSNPFDPCSLTYQFQTTVLTLTSDQIITTACNSFSRVQFFISLQDGKTIQTQSQTYPMSNFAYNTTYGPGTFTLTITQGPVFNFNGAPCPKTDWALRFMVVRVYDDAATVLYCGYYGNTPPTAHELALSANTSALVTSSNPQC